ncbi:hypothetical protein Lal_00021345 [Lupinus albus]|nr:hypothetical protein Lal_00021345 [Lupinus albus]
MVELEKIRTMVSLKKKLKEKFEFREDRRRISLKDRMRSIVEKEEKFEGLLERSHHHPGLTRNLATNASSSTTRKRFAICRDPLYAPALQDEKLAKFSS